MKTGRAGAGAPAESSCNSCPGRRNAPVSPISIPATRRPVWSLMPPPEDDAWVEGRSLVETVDDIELIDPALSSERLAYRLFHEPGVRVFPARAGRGPLFVLAPERRSHAPEFSAG